MSKSRGKSKVVLAITSVEPTKQPMYYYEEMRRQLVAISVTSAEAVKAFSAGDTKSLAACVQVMFEAYTAFAEASEGFQRLSDGKTV